MEWFLIKPTENLRPCSNRNVNDFMTIANNDDTETLVFRYGSIAQAVLMTVSCISEHQNRFESLKCTCALCLIFKFGKFWTSDGRKYGQCPILLSISIPHMYNVTLSRCVKQGVLGLAKRGVSQWNQPSWWKNSEFCFCM
jgi:hypothetical protein